MIKVVKIGLTVVAFVNNQVLQKLCANTEEVMGLYEKIINSNSEKEVETLLKPEKTQIELQYENELNVKNKELLKTKEVAQGVLGKELDGNKLFEQKDLSIYMKGINLSIPKFLAERISAASGDELSALVNFWKLCAMNPDPRARQDLFGFLKGGKFTITPRGYFVAYRNVVLKKESKNSKLESFVSSSYLKIKGWKKSPKNYVVMSSGSNYDSIPNSNSEIKKSAKYVGNLDALYKAQTTRGVESNVYTDNRTKTFHIKIGELVQMDRKKCDSDPRKDCSYGLHVGNKSFLSRGSFGNVGIAVLVNPSKVVAVPEYNQNKMRVCEYLPIGEVTYTKDGELEEIDNNLYETNYCDYDIQKLDEMIRKSGFSFEELKKNELIPYEINHASLKNIKTDLKRINELIKTRIVKV